MGCTSLYLGGLGISHFKAQDLLYQNLAFKKKKKKKKKIHIWQPFGVVFFFWGVKGHKESM